MKTLQKKPRTHNWRRVVPLMLAGGASLLLMAAVLLWAKPCDGVLELANGMHTPMRCSYTIKACILIAGLLVIVIGEALIRRKRIDGALLAFAVLLFFLPSRHGLGICQSAAMDCHVAAAWIRVSAGIILLSGLVGLIAGRTKTLR